jgi:hypothetical protein
MTTCPNPTNSLKERLIETKKQYGRIDKWTNRNKELVKQIHDFPDFIHLNDNIKEKASAIILGYIPVCLHCGYDVAFDRNKKNRSPFGDWRNFCSIKCANIYNTKYVIDNEKRSAKIKATIELKIMVNKKKLLKNIETKIKKKLKRID